jgi:hypothetical protein
VLSAPGVFFAEYARKIEENAGEIGEFPRNPFLEVAELKGDPAVVSGRFRSFSQSFPVIPGYDSDSFRFLSVFIPFHSSFSNYIITFAPEFIQLIAVMKKIILILAIIFMAIGAKAQSTIQSEDGKYPVYCDLKAYNFWGVGKVKVMLDMGAVSNGGGSFESLYGEDGKQIKFNTVMAAVNYMAKKGWILDKTYYVTEGAGRAVLHYVLVKRVKNDSEIREGLITKDEQ